MRLDHLRARLGSVYVRPERAHILEFDILRLALTRGRIVFP